MKFLHFSGERKRVTVETGTETLVEQHHRDVCNINKLVAKYARTGGFPEPQEAPRFADVSEVGEYLDVRMRMAEALDAYDELPAAITDRFSDPLEFMEWVDTQERILAQKGPESSDESPKHDVRRPEEPSQPESPSEGHQGSSVP